VLTASLMSFLATYIAGSMVSAMKTSI
jgi:hypothetical protein